MRPTLDFPEILNKFQFEGKISETAPYGTGHIHETYAACFQQNAGGYRRYIMQKINRFVFKEPEAVMHNIERVTEHMREKIASQGGDLLRNTINIIPTIEGKSFYCTEYGDYWRAFVFIEGAQTYQIAKNLDHHYHAARAFGKFQQYVSDLPIEQLHVTIPDFHHTGKRFKAFLRAVEEDRVNRASSVKAEIDFALQRSSEVNILVDLSRLKKIPERVTHNDTKLDNVMVDDISGEGICVIDLDTVMPGLAPFDFGDCVRSGANPALEDEIDLSKVCFSLHIFDRLAQGFIETTRDHLTPVELDNLAFGAKLITFEQGLRFLTDHLNGDEYYKITRSNQNLDRCRTQFKLVSDMEACYDQMIKVVDNYR